MRTGPAESRAERRRGAGAARRRLLLLAFATLLVIVAGVLANLEPLQHLLEARARLEKTSANVAELQAKKDALQAELAKLSEAAYLETLARGELAYVKPGEELYIVTESPAAGEVAGGRLGLGASIGSGDAGGRSDLSGAAPGTAAAAERPGFFERLLNTLADVF